MTITITPGVKSENMPETFGPYIECVRISMPMYDENEDEVLPTDKSHIEWYGGVEDPERNEWAKLNFMNCPFEAYHMSGEGQGHDFTYITCSGSSRSEARVRAMCVAVAYSYHFYDQTYFIGHRV